MPPLTITPLTTSHTLAAYPHWAGEVSHIPHPYVAAPAASTQHFPPHARRLHRLFVTYGTEADPGVLFATASCAVALAEVVPSSAERARMVKGWDASGVDFGQFLPEMEGWFAQGVLDATEGQGGMGVQVTEFACGSVAIGVKMAHSLADAAAMVGFVKGWAGLHRDLLEKYDGAAEDFIQMVVEKGRTRGGEGVGDFEELFGTLKSVEPVPVFDPLLLDAAASGDIQATHADPKLVMRAQELPQHRYDWWASGKTIPSGFEAKELGASIPWDEWDQEAEVAHRILHFSAKELESIWKAASEVKGGESRSRISRHDAILAFVWMLLNRARGLSHEDCPVHLNMTLGLRTRLSLPEYFVGSPILLSQVSSPGREVSDSSQLNVTAKRIRDTLGLFDAAALGAVLHEAVFQENPQRYWNGFLGRRDVLVTSWARLEAYTVNFDRSNKAEPWFVEPVMPTMAGIIEVIEAAPLANERNDPKTTKGDQRQWYRNGVDVDVNFEKAVMERIVADGMLRAFAAS
ncbi:hypothetical protein MMC13_007643 [Lambiella insularis]|nr:hypothetical protein [Lambiella insularis]